MNCLKCGREIEKDGVFCDKCLDVMAKNPIKSNAPLQLPRRKEAVQPKRSGKRKHHLPLEEQVRHQKRMIRRLMLMVGVLFVAVCLLVALLVADTISEAKADDDNLGKNYSTSESGEE